MRDKAEQGGGAERDGGRGAVGTLAIMRAIFIAMPGGYRGILAVEYEGEDGAEEGIQRSVEWFRRLIP